MSGASATPASGPGPRVGLATLVGPGLMVAATGVGSGDLAGATVAGANFGLVLIWAILLGAILKFALTEGIARWQLATGSTVMEGWAAHLPTWAQAYFGVYLIVWTVAVSAALANACGLGIAHLTGGQITTAWGAVLHSLIGCAFVWAGGFRGFERAMKILIGLMVVTLVTCAALTLENVGGAVSGALVPRVPPGSAASLLALIGGVGGTITILSYCYWMQEEGIAGAVWLRYVRVDLVVAYTVTAALAIAVLLIANQAFFVTGVDLNAATVVPQMADSLGLTLGPLGRLAYGLGFWGAVFSSLLGVWQSVPYLFADLYGILRRYPADRRAALTRVTSRPYRVALLLITLVPIPLAFLGRPLALLVIYTVVGSFFIPFLAATLLYLNNRVPWSSPLRRNGWAANVAMTLALLFFLYVGVRDVLGVF